MALTPAVDASLRLVGLLASGHAALDFRFHPQQTGVSAELGQGDGVLMAQQLAVAEHEGVTLELALRQMGAQDLGGHGEG